MRRTLRLLKVQARTAALVSAQYRVEFWLGTVMAVFWTATALAPLAVLFSLRDGVAGWKWHDALVVVGFFTILKGFLSGAMQPSLMSAVESIRRGTLDFLLLKPVDSQLMVSTSRFDLARVADLLTGAGVIAYGLARGGRSPGAGDYGLAALLLLSGIAVLYAIWIFAISLAFHVVKVDNLTYLIGSTYDAARWPSSVFRGVLAFFFTAVIPLALMTTYPALAILGRITASQVAISLGVACAFLAASRWTWQASVRRYTSAGG